MPCVSPGDTSGTLVRPKTYSWKENTWALETSIDAWRKEEMFWMWGPRSRPGYGERLKGSSPGWVSGMTWDKSIDHRFLNLEWYQRSINRGIKKMWYTCPMDYHSAIKKNEILLYAATWIDCEGLMRSEISQRKNDDVTHMWNPKKYNKLVNKTKRSRLADIENKLVVTSGGEGRGEGQCRRRGLLGDHMKSHVWNFWKL